MNTNCNDATGVFLGVAAKGLVKRKQKSWQFIYDVNKTSINDLNKIALEDGSRKYTYNSMFCEWKRYASVFSAMNIGCMQKSRVGILGSTSSEVIFSFYGLNMVGADVSIIPSYSALTPTKIIETIQAEKLTDFIITDDFAQVNLIYDLLVQKNNLGLNNVIILHIPITGVTVSSMLTAAQETKYQYLKGQFRPICMDELLKIYGNHPINYAENSSRDTALILHTSGTTSGTGKPVPLSDEAINSAVATFYNMPELNLPWDNLVTAIIVDLSNAYGFIDQVHLPFAMGATVVITPGGVLNPWFYKAIPEHKITFLFTISAMFLRWLKMTDQKKLDFSSLKFVILGGTSVSVDEKKTFLDFMKKHGAGDITILNGYGISELGGACCLSTSDIEDESIGYPLPGVNVRLYDDKNGRFLTSNDIPGEGVLYLNSPSLATISLDNKDILKVDYVEDTPYICTNDLVSMDSDGKLTFLGRACRYFINDENKSFDAGRVENEFAKISDIEGCCIIPVYVKTTHDNIPMLCVKTTTDMDDSQKVVLDALKKIYIEDKRLDEDNIPLRIKISEDLPRNGNGKIDLYKIRKGDIEGNTYIVKAKKKKNILSDFQLVPYEDGPADMIKEVFDGLSAELKASLPHNKNNINNLKEGYNMKNSKNFMDGFNAMNQMGRQMMDNMKNMTGQMNQNHNFCNMPNMSKIMENMQHMNQQTTNMIPNMLQINQMMNTMLQMNMTALNMMQKTFEQNYKMMNQYMDLMTEFNQKAMKKTNVTDATNEKNDEEPGADDRYIFPEDETFEDEPLEDEPVESEPEKKARTTKSSSAKKTTSTKKATGTKKASGTKKSASTKKATSSDENEIKIETENKSSDE